MENSIVDCQNSDSRRLLPLDLDSTSPDAERCLDYEARLNSASGTGTPLSSGVFIIESFRFCTNKSIGRILMRINSPSSAINVEEFHIYKQYRDGGDSEELFVRSTSFYVIISYSEELNVLVAVPVTPTRADQGDYLGLTLPEDIEILTTRTGISDGMYSVSSPIGQCHGSALDVFKIDINNIITGDPLISVEEEWRMSKCLILKYVLPFILLLYSSYNTHYSNYTNTNYTNTNYTNTNYTNTNYTNTNYNNNYTH